MTAIERTAYPTFDAFSSHQQEMDDYYTPTREEIRFIQNKLRRSTDNGSSNYAQHQLNAVTLLKCFQRLGYFPSLRTVPRSIADHLRSSPAIGSRYTAWL